jgi:hypothetical protein
MCSLRFRCVNIVALFSIPILSGCGGFSLTEVTGQVKYNGKPLDKPGGTISFLGPDGLPHSGEIDSSGNYRVANVCLGDNKVSVYYPRDGAHPEKRKRGPDQGPPADRGKTSQSPFLTPESYASPETSGLTVVVDKSTVYNPDLKGPEIK